MTSTQKRRRTNSLDLQKLNNRCTHISDVAEVYLKLETLGLAYGPAFQSMLALRSNKKRALAHIRLPDTIRPLQASCVLPPSLLDSAFQSAIGILEAGDEKVENPPLLVPFRLGKIEIIEPLSASECLVHLRLKERSNDGQDWHFDLDLADPEGKIKISVRALVLREMRLAIPAKSQSSKAVQDSGHALRAVPEQALSASHERVNWRGQEQEWHEVAQSWTTTWQPESLSGALGTASGTCLVFDNGGSTSEFRKFVSQKLTGLTVVRVTPHTVFARFDEGHYGMSTHSEAQYTQLLQAQAVKDAPTYVLWLAKDHDLQNIGQLNTGAEPILPLFYLLKALLNQTRKTGTRLIAVSASKDDAPNPVHAATAGMLKSAMREQPRFCARVVEFCGTPMDSESLVSEMLDANTHDTEIRYLPGGRMARRVTAWTPSTLTPATHKSERRGLTKGSTYFITGGIGGIGKTLARHLATHYQAKLILCGRRAASSDTQALVAELQRQGGQAMYVEADVSDSNSLNKVVADANNAFGPIHACSTVPGH
ncbi:hypothetical protein CS022_23860 [Veronia nyctiphanis]|uniref:PKS/mFAS DH domain-containing protein n=1 Tax=Veronia nyctiphanis TaxID=1278244 RepID=A0A4Q0YGP8_9GAMM|nr:hypothetical protein CS022_23860 [Veronia nyctiphanis]